MTPYVELHLHSCYSFLDGSSFPDELIQHAAELGYLALAITDHDGLYGAMEFAQAARDVGIQPITGAELTLEDGSHLTLLAETARGYANLCKLITIAHHHGDYLDPQLPFSALQEHTTGLILLTGCRQGELAQLVDEWCFNEARAVIARYCSWFGNANVFVELQQNLVHGDTRRNRRLMELADESGVSYVATGNVHYHIRDRWRLQAAMAAIKHRATLDTSHHLRKVNSEWFLQPPEAVARRFKRYPEAIANTLVIAERCRQFDLTQDLQYRFPDYPTQTPDESACDILDRVTRELLEDRYGDNPRAEERLAEELRLVKQHDLAGFFLTYRDIMQLAGEVADEIRGPSTARSMGNLPAGRGRGSSVSSIICYLIGLSHIDPLNHNLILDRFLNEELVSVPDIDLDFSRDIRERLIERIYEVYGHDHAALVCAFPTYRIKSAIRDLGKVLGLPSPSLDRLAKLAERGKASDLGEHIAATPDLEQDESPLWPLLGELAGQIAGMPRHISQHSGGMVIASQPLNELVPIQPAAMEGRYIAQWDKDSVEDARMIKIDFLALGMLSLVEECLEHIVESGNEPVDLSQINIQDEKVFDMIRAGDTLGTFQIESRAQIQTLLKVQPRNLADLIVQVAIVRPGPIVGGATSLFVQARQQEQELGYATPTYDHSLLEPILKETYGAILYQDQIIEVAMALAGFSAGQGDRLRRALNRKRSEVATHPFWREFRDGAASKGVPEETARIVFEKIMGFSHYGFPKAHAAAFAVLAYQSCWLRYHYPAEFVCALFNNQPMGFYPPHVLVGDAKRHGIRIMKPDINLSGAACTVEGRGVRIGFGYITGIGEEQARLLETERENNGEYLSLVDLVRRVSIRRELIERLVLAGACDGFGLRRREAIWQIGLFQPENPAVRTAKQAGQMSLDLSVSQDMVSLKPMRAWDQMKTDFLTMTLSPHYHPLLLLRPHQPAGVVTTAGLETLPDGAQIAIAGLVVCRQHPLTAKGVTFLLLEDEHGLVNVVVYPALFERERLLITQTPLLLVVGTLQRQANTINVVAQRFAALDTSAVELGWPPEDNAVEEKEFSPAAHNFH